MNKPFRLRVLQTSLLPILISLTLWSFSKNLVAQANELSDLTGQQNTSEQPDNSRKDSTPPSESKKPTELPKENRDDRVYIEDIYPEYCRSYFHRRDWVSLFEYREGMYRCFHGVDRWF